MATAAARDPRARPADAVELLALLRGVRATLTDAQLDAVPPRASDKGHVPDGSEGTTVLRRAPADAPALNRTSRFQLPPDLIRPEDSSADMHHGGAQRSRRGLIALVTALVLLVGGGAVVWYVSIGQFTSVPAVLAITRAQAEQRLHSAGLGVRITEAYSETVAKGHVISTDPGPGGRIRGNGVVQVVVSRGPQRVDVPALTGLPLARARQRIASAGLITGAVTRSFDNTVPAGAVISTDPPQGTPPLVR